MKIAVAILAMTFTTLLAFGVVFPDIVAIPNVFDVTPTESLAAPAVQSTVVSPMETLATPAIQGTVAAETFFSKEYTFDAEFGSCPASHGSL